MSSISSSRNVSHAKYSEWEGIHTPHCCGIRMYLLFVFVLLALGGQGAWQWYFTSDKSFTWTQPSWVMSPKVVTWLAFGSISEPKIKEAFAWGWLCPCSTLRVSIPPQEATEWGGTCLPEPTGGQWQVCVWHRARPAHPLRTASLKITFCPCP